MKIENLRTLVKEELEKTLNEDYQDKFKMVGTLITNIKERPQKEIYSDIRAIPGITVISSTEPLEYSEQDKTKFKTILSVKVDGYPWITKGGFNREKLKDIAQDIKQVPGVKAFFTKDENISTL
tara:strand:- start:12669 stop:13040 length:372 start_codon:yes stop_codon:yes gene_type:complete